MNISGVNSNKCDQCNFAAPQAAKLITHTVEKSPTNEVSDSSIQANVICKYTELTDPGLRQS